MYPVGRQLHSRYKNLSERTARVCFNLLTFPFPLQTGLLPHLGHRLNLQPHFLPHVDPNFRQCQRRGQAVKSEEGQVQKVAFQLVWWVKTRRRRDRERVYLF